MTHPAGRLRVLLVAARSLPYMGGVELHVAEVARRLAAAGVDTTVLSTDVSGELPPAETVDGVAIRRVRAYPRRRDYYFAPRLYRELASERWDLVHVQGYHTLVAPLAMHAARRLRLPYVLTFHAGGHSSALRHAVRPLQLAALRPLLAGAERLVALAPHEIDDYSRRLALPRERFALIPNGSDLPALPPGDRPEAEEGLIASIGRLERYKGHHRILAALPAIIRRRPDARLWLGGSGPHEVKLRAQAARLGVASQVEIRSVPAGDRAEMARRLARVQVAVLLSEFETQPIAALEALAAGCRLVVSDAPGLGPLAADGLARALPLRSDPEAIASAVLEELDKPRRERPPQLPSWDDCAEQLRELYVELSLRRRVVPARPSSTPPVRRRRAA